jgi:hypothetical protein
VTENTATGDGGGILNIGFGVPPGTVILNRSDVEDTPQNCSPPIAGCRG